MKVVSTVLLLLTFAIVVHSQQAAQLEKSAAQRVDTVIQINIASYHCFTSQFLSVTVRKECDAYVADWRQYFGQISLEKPTNGTVILDEGQLKALTKFAQHVSPATMHNAYCRGTTKFKFTSVNFQKKEQLCDCSPNVLGELLSIMGNSKQNSGQHPL